MGFNFSLNKNFTAPAFPKNTKMLAFFFIIITAATAININNPQMFPESAVFSTTLDSFVLGSAGIGNVFEVDSNGEVDILLTEGLAGSITLGVKVDDENGRVWVCANNGTGAFVNIYSIETKDLVASLLMDSAINSLCNDIIITPGGNIGFATDSFGDRIFKIDLQASTIKLESDNALFKKKAEGFGLDGIAMADDLILVNNLQDGTLIKYSLSSQEATLVDIDGGKLLNGPDGMILDGKTTLLVAESGTGDIATLETTDNWNTAKVIKRTNISNLPGDLTAVVKRENKVFALRSRLDKFGGNDVIANFELVEVIEVIVEEEEILEVEDDVVEKDDTEEEKKCKKN
jgi:hypothetical protein